MVLDCPCSVPIPKSREIYDCCSPYLEGVCTNIAGWNLLILLLLTTAYLVVSVHTKERWFYKNYCIWWSAFFMMAVCIWRVLHWGWSGRSDTEFDTYLAWATSPAGDMPNVMVGYTCYLAFLYQVLNDSNYGAGFDDSTLRRNYGLYWWAFWFGYGLPWIPVLNNNREKGSSYNLTVY